MCNIAIELVSVFTCQCLSYTFDNVIVHCTEKVLCCTPECRFWVTERVGQQKVVGATNRVLCTWQQLGLAVKAIWLVLGGPILALAV